MKQVFLLLLLLFCVLWVIFLRKEKSTVRKGKFQTKLSGAVDLAINRTSGEKTFAWTWATYKTNLLQLQPESAIKSNNVPSRNSYYKTPFNETPIRRLPNCIIIGVSKCGTRALLEYLSLNPFIVIANKEINFFNVEELYHMGLPWYKDQMPLSYSNQLTIEKSPDVFQCPICPERIYTMNKKMKLFLLLRDPVERLISQYMQFVDKNNQLGRQMPPFNQWILDPETNNISTKIPAVNDGMYAVHLHNWLEIFPWKQIHLIDGYRFARNPLTELPAVEHFLGLPPFLSKNDIYYNGSKGFHCLRNRFTGKTRCLGPTKGRPHIRVDRDILDKLRDFYHPYNVRLRDLVGQQLSWL